MVQRATFKSFEESTKEEWANIMVCIQDTQAMVADRVIEQLKMLELDQGGFPVNRLEHCLQTATRAEKDGRDAEYIMCSLIHDIGDNLAPFNHPDIAAGILKPTGGWSSITASSRATTSGITSVSTRMLASNSAETNTSNTPKSSVQSMTLLHSTRTTRAHRYRTLNQ